MIVDDAACSTVMINNTGLYLKVSPGNPQKPYLLILHGGPGLSSIDFEYSLGPHLERRFNVIYLDQRYSGRSYYPVKNSNNLLEHISFKLLIDDIESVRINLGVKNWHIMGHSWGGLLGLLYTLEYPDRVKAFMSISGAFDMEEVLMQGFKKVRDIYRSWLSSKNPEKVIDAQKRLSSLERTNSRNQDPLFRFRSLLLMATETNGYFSAHTNSSTRNKWYMLMKPYFGRHLLSKGLVRNECFDQVSMWHEFSRVAVPSLFITGEDDGIVIPSHTKRAASIVKNSMFYQITKSAHFPYFENTAQVSRVIGKFL